jgi:hypothetical protein
MTEESLASLRRKLDFLYDKKNLYLKKILIEATEFSTNFNLLEERDINIFFNRRNINFNSLFAVNRTIESISSKININKNLNEREKTESSFLMKRIIEKDKIIIMKIRTNMQHLKKGLNKISKFESYIKA